MSHFNFEESISIGIERADVAEANKKEIEEIFNDFSESFQRASNNKIFAEIKSRQRTITLEKPNPLLGVTAAFLNSISYEYYKALVLSNGSEEYVIAEIIENEDGYPLRIKVKDDTSAYSDQESLVDGLSRLVTRTEVGKFYKLLLTDS
ncbi:hypothetical protein ABFP35_02795 [Acinetobacter baumannii]|uniref:hypothetical protein n=1 Tax=Acinetobacter calcoaceticus/baumannii complex TaxID=909768 RepID=UPI0008391FEF|nr:hypothetical protein [Acinetobacter pittii]MDC5280854.1 hypothetical protein [Acinetobacter baumannii]MDC5642688.1 hypothetical protein [Acinetobacter baumannii]OCY46941.1 hypothetical protein BFR77_01240 [Acinetobacter pittii]OOT53356.1 hypothetical protein BTG92_07000 [Acinetobacter pittii]OTU69890.1 hypothetical protein CAT31_03295 [Acinetobacter pittii]